MNTKQLRQKVLDLAIHGKLVPQEGEWKETILGEVCNFESGLAYPSEKYKAEGTPLVRISNICDGKIDLSDCVFIDASESTKHYYVNRGDLLIAMSGATTGKMGVYQEDNLAVLNQRVGNIKIKNNDVLIEGYRNIIMESLKSEIEKQAYGGAQPNISGKMICAMSVPLPPLSEQHRIVAAVEQWMSLIDVIESGKKNLQQSIALAKNKILDLAIRGKLVPQDPADEPASVLLQRIRKEKEQLVKEGKLKKKDLETTPIADDEKPFDIPESWEWCRLGVIASFHNGDRSSNYPNKEEYVEKGIAWINTGHIEPAGYLSTSKMNYITEEKFNSLSSGKIQKGDLVYCLRGATYGKVSRVDPFEKGAVASSLMIIRLINVSFREYIYYFLLSTYAKEILLSFANGAAQPNLAAKDVAKYVLPLPPLSEQQRIVAKIEELFAQLDSIEKSLN